MTWVKARTAPSTGENITYATLLAESKAVKAQIEREKREQEQAARQRHLQDIHEHQDDYWRQVEQAAIRQTSTGYDEAVRLLIELRDAEVHFKETQKFQRLGSASPSHPYWVILLSWKITFSRTFV